MALDTVKYGGWQNSIRLANSQVELIVTTDVGPRVIRFGYIGKKNVFGELKSQTGKSGEKKWMIRGGHRFWAAPEEKPKTYELDNIPVKATAIANGVKIVQPVGPLSGLQKSMSITLLPKENVVKVVHTLTNKSRKAVVAAPWALTVMGLRGMAVIPLPVKIPHTARLTHNQSWSLWGYTDFGDKRWMLGSKYIFFRQDPKKGPNKLGMAHREGWAAYLTGEFMFVKRFKRVEGAVYPDDGMNFETFSNEDILELESLGPLVTIRPGKSVTHDETWELHKGIKYCKTEADIDRYVLPRIK